MFTADDNATSRQEHMIANKEIVDWYFHDKLSEYPLRLFHKNVLEYFHRNV